MSRALRRVRLRIRGRVQGVGFRYRAEEQAARLRLTGWARNREDGRVELVVEGEPERVAAFVAWCREGPPLATVNDVEEEALEGETRRYDDFRIVYDAPE